MSTFQEALSALKAGKKVVYNGCVYHLEGEYICNERGDDFFVSSIYIFQSNKWRILDNEPKKIGKIHFHPDEVSQNTKSCLIRLEAKMNEIIDVVNKLIEEKE